MNLTSEQEQAVTASEEKIFVIAPPGSGKTRVLTSRLQYLLAQGYPPSQVRAITFTRKAAKEIRDRLPELPRNLYVGTFHSLCNNFLSHAPGLFGLKVHYTIIDEADQADILKFLSALYNISVRDPKMEGIFRRELIKSNSVTYDMLEEFALSVVAKYPDMLRGWTLVDEVQDTSEQQFSLLRHAERIFAVGDIHQAIYGWRGALADAVQPSLDGMGCQKYYLTENFRSCLPICGFCESIFPGTKIISHSQAPGMVEFGVKDIQTIRNILDQNMNPERSIAILFRTNKEVDRYGMELKEAGYPVTILTKSQDYWGTPQVKTLIRLLKLYQNTDNDLFCALLMQREFSFHGILECMLKSKEKELPLFLSYLELVEKFDKLRTHICNRSGSEFVVEFARHFNYETEERIKLDSELQAISPYLPAMWHVKDFLRYLSDRSLQEMTEEQPEQRKIVCSTIHAAKGLEFDVVITTDARSAEGEERRIFYVACSRAKEQLYLLKKEEK